MTVQCMIYASLATSLSYAFVAMLGKQRPNRIVRNSREELGPLGGVPSGGSMALPHRYEGLPVLLQIALVLLGSALFLYLWSINHIVSGVVLAVMAFGVIFYGPAGIVGTFVYKCPYQTALSLTAGMILSHLGPRIQQISTALAK